MDPGYIAAFTFLITSGGGSLAQVVKLRERERSWRAGTLSEAQICEGLHPIRELWSFSAFSLFALSALTRSYIDLFLLGSRLPAIVLATLTIWIVSKHQGGRATSIFRFALGVDLLVLAVLVVALTGSSLGGTALAISIDLLLAGVSGFLFFGKMLQATTMLRERQTRAVSWLRELGLVIKDISGLWYALGVGSELRWVAITHVLSGISSSAICLAKAYVERTSSRRKDME